MDWKGYQDDDELHKADKTYSKNKYLITTTFSACGYAMNTQHVLNDISNIVYQIVTVAQSFQLLPSST